MQQKETLSAFMDGAKVDENFLDTLCDSSELKQKWANYHTIRSVMQGDEIILGDDFSAKMEALLENEEIESQSSVQAEAPAKPRGLLVKLRRWSTLLIQAGVAASVCLVAVLGVNVMNSNNSTAEVAQQIDQPVLQTLPFSNSLQPVSYNAPERDVVTAEQLENQQRKLNTLLQNHELQRRTNVGAVTLTDEQKEKAQTSSNEATKPVEQK